MQIKSSTVTKTVSLARRLKGFFPLLRLTLQQESEIKEKAQKIKEEKKLRKIYPMVVFGEAGDENIILPLFNTGI